MLYIQELYFHYASPQPWGEEVGDWLRIPLLFLKNIKKKRKNLHNIETGILKELPLPHFWDHIINNCISLILWDHNINNREN